MSWVISVVGNLSSCSVDIIYSATVGSCPHISTGVFHYIKNTPEVFVSRFKRAKLHRSAIQYVDSALPCTDPQLLTVVFTNRKHSVCANARSVQRVIHIGG